MADEDYVIEPDEVDTESSQLLSSASSVSTAASEGKCISSRLLKRKIESSDPEITLREPGPRKKSPCWTSFKAVYFKGEDTKYAFCMSCKDALILTQKGINGLNHHSKKCSSGRGNIQAQITDHFPLVDFKEPNKEKLLQIILKFLLKDLKPFSLVERDGYIKHLTEISIYSKSHGPFNFKQLNLNHRTMTRRAVALFQELKQKLKLELSTVTSLSITLDHWTEIHQHRSYLVVMCHYLNDRVYHTRMMAFREAIDKKAITLITQVDEILDEYDVKHKVAFVRTDGHSSNRKAFTSKEKQFDNPNTYENIFLDDDDADVANALPINEMIEFETKRRIPRIWTRCVAHQINLALQKSFKELEKLDDIMAIMNSCKKIVKYYKQGLTLDLPITPKSYCETRWDSRLRMLDSLAYEEN